MRSYIVRIYRKEKGKPHGIVGLVQDVDSQVERPFRNVEELARILLARRRGADISEEDKSGKQPPGAEGDSRRAG